MKIQKGLVKYKDRNDIVCTYGITDDGRQLYFLNDSKLSNDNVIVTTTLVEAIDQSVAHTHVGVTNQDGVEVVPCVNKAIKLITKDLLLVEPADPVSPFVIEANKNKKDPVEAQKLVNASATIKDNISKVMGNDGRYIFNDLFSEATLCDIDGNNLVNNNYYSFIAINKKGDTIYLAGNTKDSNVDSFSLVSNKLNDSVVVNQDIVVPDVETAPVDVSQVEVEPVNLENEVTPPVQEVVETPPVEESSVDAFDVTAPAPVIPTEELVENIPVDTPPVENAVKDVPLDVFETSTPKENVVSTEDEIAALVNQIETPEPSYSPAVDLPENREVTKIEDEDKVEELDDEKDTTYEPLDLPKKPFDFSEDIKKIDDSYNDLSLDDLLNSSNISYKKHSNKESNIMLEAANTISKLIDVNSNQKSELNDYKDQVRQLTTLNKKVVDKARRDLDRVQSSISSKDNEIDLLKTRIQDIEAQLRDKERMINNQEDELANLRSQVEGKRDLQKVLADADSYLDGE